VATNRGRVSAPNAALSGPLHEGPRLCRGMVTLFRTPVVVYVTYALEGRNMPLHSFGYASVYLFPGAFIDEFRSIQDQSIHQKCIVFTELLESAVAE
jgi:hypothetical protein